MVAAADDILERLNRVDDVADVLERDARMICAEDKRGEIVR